MNIFLSKIYKLNYKNVLNIYNTNIKYKICKGLINFQYSRNFITENNKKELTKDFKINNKEIKFLEKLINKVKKYNLDDEIKAKIYAGNKFKKDKKMAKKSLKKQLKKNSVDVKLIYDLLDNLPKKTFTDKRAIICVILLFTTGCKMNELRNFNKFTINNLIQNGTLILNKNKTKINISDFEKNILEENLPLINDFYKFISDDKHILHSQTGKEIKEKTAYIWINNILKRIGDEKGIKFLSQSFRIGYISEIIKYYNNQIEKPKSN